MNIFFKQKSRPLTAVAASFLLLGLVGGAPTVYADNCIQDVWKANGNNQNLTCTSNDVRIASAENIRDTAGNPLSQCVLGSTFSFIADFRVNLTAQARFDLGLYFETAVDQAGDGALTGTCDVSIIRPRDGLIGSENFVNLDDPSDPGDTCGDINAANNPQIVGVRVDNVLCQDTDGDGFLNLPNCTSWRQPGSNETCNDPGDAFPGSPSKCNCDPDFNVDILVETGDITVTKDSTPASLPEPGGEFTYPLTVTNDASFVDVTIDRICDDKFGEIAKVAAAPACPAGTVGTINSTTCTVPQTLTPGAMYACEFRADFTGNAGDMLTDTVTFFGADQNGAPVDDSDSAMVQISDVAPMAQVLKQLDSLQCARVRYEVEVRNTSTVESLELTALNDNGFGDITSVQGDVLGTTCGVASGIGTLTSQGGAGTLPATLATDDGAAGGPDTYTCRFDAQFCAASHSDIVTGTLEDDEGTSINEMSNELTVNVSASTTP